MSKYVLSPSKKKNILSIQKKTSYTFDSNNELQAINVSKIKIYDKEVMDSFSSYFAKKNFDRLLMLIKKIIDDDSSEEGYLRCLDMIAKYEDILENRYKHYLKIEKYNEFIETISMLRDYINSKVFTIKDNASYNIGGGR